MTEQQQGITWLCGIPVGQSSESWEAAQLLLERVGNTLSPDEWQVISNLLAEGCFLRLQLQGGSVRLE